ncbi:hypothetical protein [Kitasatospora sp. NPDC002040]|uniref:hypothetical protein n=1 Tax=Kitasatospora sp. NPDC002040 TaxID=3154661 RepID=UPI00331A7B17
MKDLYQGTGHLHRYRDHCTGRLGGTTTSATAIVDETLTGGDAARIGNESSRAAKR